MSDSLNGSRMQVRSALLTDDLLARSRELLDAKGTSTAMLGTQRIDDIERMTEINRQLQQRQMMKGLR